MRKIKICYFCELWESGGIESFLTGVIKSLDMSIFSVDVISAKMGESIFTAPLKDLGVRFYELSGKLRSPKNYGIFKKLLRENQYDILHFNIFQAYAFRYVKIAKDVGIEKRIVHAHGAGLRKSKTRALKYALHCISRFLWKKHITDTLACSGVAANFLFGSSPDGIIKNGINAKSFAFSDSERESYRSSLGIGDSPLIGSVGRLSSEKNQDFLLKVFSKIIVTVPDAKLLLVGDGPDKERLVTLARELKISDSVIFYGASSDIPSLMSAMDSFVFPSLFEGLGIVAIEAQASGLPTVCSTAVPTDVNITNLVRFVSLDESTDQWARVIIDSLNSSSDRSARWEEVKRAGFDSQDTPKEMLKYYTLPS